jgi:nicotinate dehydrogenase subunit A
MAVSLKVNGAMHSVPAEPDTPLLYVLSNDLQLNGARFGCGLAQCGACTVLVDGQPVRSCITEVGSVGPSEVTTLEGLGTAAKPHRLQQAFMDEQAAQCGYRISGMIMSAKALLDHSSHPGAALVREGLADNLCRAAATVASSAPCSRPAKQPGGSDDCAHLAAGLYGRARRHRGRIHVCPEAWFRPASGRPAREP